MNYIQRNFKDSEFDLQKGLACKLYLRRLNWQRAESEYLQIRSKEYPENKALRVQILKQKIEDITTSALQRQKAQQELIELEDHRLVDLFDLNFEFEPADLEE